MHQAKIRNTIAIFPEQWVEISRRNLMFIASNTPLEPTQGTAIRFFWHCMADIRNLRAAFALARNYILSKKMDKAYKNDAVCIFGESNIFQQQVIQAILEMDSFSFMHKGMEFPENLIPQFRIGLRHYYGPKNRLSNVTADEFRHAELFRTKFFEDKNEKWLFLMIATLWREKGSNNPTDIRVEFNEFALEKRARQFKKLPKKIKIGCLLNYIAMRNSWANEPVPKYVFSSSKGSESEDSDFSVILMRLAESNVFGSYQITKSAFIHDIIEHLADLKKRNETLQK